DLLRSALRFYPTIRKEDLRVSIVSSTDRILPTMHEKLARAASKHLLREGVQLRLKTTLVSASAGELVLSTGERIQSRTVIVTAGIAPNPVVASLPVQKDRGRVKTDEFCRVPGFEGVYAVGDNASIPHYKTGEPCPASALYAFTQGMRAGDNILAELRGKPLRPYTFRNFGEVAQLGDTFGLIQFFGKPFSGFLALLLVRIVFFLLIPSWRCRLGLLSDWICAIVLPPDVTQMKIARTDMVLPLRFSAGQDIIRQGEPGSRFYIVNSGKVEVIRRTGTSEQVLATLGPGKYFGEVALLQGSDRTATVRAVEDTTVLSIARKDFTTLVENLPVLGQAMSETSRTALSLTTSGQ
ncbi:MAG: cyclic nucleotide-binding domain-containing protein, partial [Acidobacteriota bacterium]